MSSESVVTYLEGGSMEVDFDIDGRQSHLGHSIEKQWGTSRLEDGGYKVQGCMTPVPKVGQTVCLRDGVYRFTEVRAERNPPDLYFGQIEPVEMFKASNKGER